MSVTVSVDVHLGYVNANVDLGDINTEDLQDELRSRGANVPEGDIEEKITEMFWAFKANRIEHAMKLAIKIAENHTGRIL